MIHHYWRLKQSQVGTNSRRIPSKSMGFQGKSYKQLQVDSK